VIPKGWLLAVVTVNSVMVPTGVTRPILLTPASVNQRLPSGPAVIPRGVLLAVGTANSLNPAENRQRISSVSRCNGDRERFRPRRVRRRGGNFERSDFSQWFMNMGVHRV